MARRVFYHISVLDVKVNADMSRMKSTTVPENNSPVLQDTSGFGGLAMEEIHRIFAEEELDKSFDRWTSHFDHEKGLKDKENANKR